MRMFTYFTVATAFFLAIVSEVYGQQSGDKNFVPLAKRPIFERNAGPLVLIDEFHNNFHTKNGRYQPFTKVLESDGYLVASNNRSFSESILTSAKVLVISNALGDTSGRGWALPVMSAFEDEEINAVEAFVEQGGGLFLIADHMPFPGAASKLASRFGIQFSNAYAFEVDDGFKRINGPTVFLRSEKRIGDHPITNGRDATEKIQKVVSFTGSAFPITNNATSIIRFSDNARLFFPDEAWQFDANTPIANIPKWSQGLALDFGKGRVEAICNDSMLAESQQLSDTAQVKESTYSIKSTFVS